MHTVSKTSNEQNTSANTKLKIKPDFLQIQKNYYMYFWNRAWSLPLTTSSAYFLSVENFSQRVSLIREVRNVETKAYSQRRLNNNKAVI